MPGTTPWTIVTLRLTQHLRIHCGRLTCHSEPTLALLQLLTGGMEAPGHEQKVTLQNQTHHYKIRSAPARSRPSKYAHEKLGGNPPLFGSLKGSLFQPLVNAARGGVILVLSG